ncbi:lamin tail domain-containing protein [Candidatus Woesearchaeota archaeon]|nr:lamin tail domain-containing protein [Candidatus Woesearchaeota archaeon]
MHKLSWIIILSVAIFSTSVIAANSDVVITELMFDPPNTIVGQAQDSYRCVNDSSCQWIEIYNSGDTAIDLSSWKIRTDVKENVGGFPTQNHDFGDVIIQPKSFVVIATQLGDEDGDGFSFARLYGNKDGIWDSSDGFTAVDSSISFLETPDLFPGTNTNEDIRLVEETGTTLAPLIFSSYYTDPVNVQKNNGYTMERDTSGKYPQGLELGGSPGKARNVPPKFTSIPNVTLTEDQVLPSRLLDFRNFSSDLETNDNDLVFSITSLNSNPSSLISCGVIGTEDDPSKTYFLNCTNLAKDTFGTASVFVSASDGISTTSGNFSLNVRNINDAPTFTSNPINKTTATLPYIYDADANDIEGNSLIFSLKEPPIGMIINSTTGVINWTPTASQIGNNNIEIVVTDNLTQAEKIAGLIASSFTQKFDIIVEPIFGFSNVNVAYNGGAIDGVNPEQTIPRVFISSDFNVTLNLINRHPLEQGLNIIMEDIVLTAKFYKGSQVVFDREISSGFTMNSLETKQIPFTFNVPRDLEEGIYTLDIKAKGNLFDVDEDLIDNIVPQSQTFTLNLDVQQARHDVYISSISPVEEAVCTKQSKLRIDVKNSGTRIERDLQLSSFYSPLNISLNSIIDRLSPGETKTTFVNVTNGGGLHNVTAQITYSEGTGTNTLVGFEACTRIGDFNKDFCINEKDSALLSKKIGLKSSDANFDSIFDINKDGFINFNDFFELIDIMDPECTTIVAPASDETTPPAVVVSGEGFNVGISQIKIVLQQGTSFVSQFFVTNRENTSIITSNKIDGSFSVEDKTVNFEFPSSLSLLAGSTSPVNLKADAPEQFKAGVYSGSLSLKTNKQTTTLPLEIEVIPDICEEGIKGSDISIDITDPDKGENLKPGDKIDVDISVKNKGNTRDISVEGILWNVDKDEEVESIEIDSIEIDKGDTEKDDFDFEITVPEDVEDDKIVLYIKAFEDGSEEEACNVQSVGLDVDRERNDVRIVEVVAPKELKCDSNTVIRVNARNFGKDDEKAFFRITNYDIGLNLESRTFDIKEFDKNGDFVSESMSFNVPVTDNEKSLFIVSIVYNDGADMQSVDKEIQITCGEDKTIESSVDMEADSNEKDGNTLITGDKGVSVIKSYNEEIESDGLLIQTAVFLSFVLGLGVVAYALKSAVLAKK